MAFLEEFEREAAELIENIVYINRVTKVTKGGKTLKMSVWVVVGDGNGHVGIGHGKAAETPEAIQKALRRARKNMKSCVVKNGTLPYEVIVKEGASKILLKPAAPGTGIIATQAVRSVLEAAGYQNVLTKSLGSNNPINLMKATFKAITTLVDPEKVVKERGLNPEKSLRRFGRVKQVAQGETD
ncbi:MAG: 30S ribosomal protein S5 [candidate division WOR-3 bacterium]